MEKQAKEAQHMRKRHKIPLTVVAVVVAAGCAGMVLADHQVIDTGVPAIWQSVPNTLTGDPEYVYRSAIEDCSLLMDRADLDDSEHYAYLMIIMICDDEDEVYYHTYDPTTGGTDYVESEPGPFDYGIHDIEECYVGMTYHPERQVDLENVTVSLPESIRIVLDCVIDD